MESFRSERLNGQTKDHEKAMLNVYLTLVVAKSASQRASSPLRGAKDVR